MPPGIEVRSKDVARAGAAGIAVVVALHIASQIARFAFGRDYQLGLAAKLYLGAETSLPNWFSTILLLACAAALFVIAAASRDRARWVGLAIIFTALSLDEAAALHDLASPFFTGVMARLADTVGGPFVALARKPNYAWQIPALFACAAIAVAYAPFVARLPRRTRNGFLLAGLVYVGAAIDIDFIEGWYSDLKGPRNPTFVALLTCEEGFEMIGALLFLVTLLRHLESEFGGVRIMYNSSFHTPTGRTHESSRP